MNNRDEILDEILDQLNKLTAQVKDIIAEKEELKSFDDNLEETIVEYDGKYHLKAVKGYSPHVNTLCSIDNTGNGYIAHFPAYSPIEQDNYICLDYAEAEYLYKLLKHLY